MKARVLSASLPCLRGIVHKSVPRNTTSYIATRTMATVKDHIPHTERTANDPRQTGLFDAKISRIDQINSKIRLLRLSLPPDGPRLNHLPGQYLDVHLPGVAQAGGFTITSPPSTTGVHPSPNSPSAPRPNPPKPPTIPLDPYVELAIQKSAHNPPAAYLWRPIPDLQDTPLQLRVGGAFVYPPSSYTREEAARIDRVVFVAGGVGINPIMSMLSAMAGRAPGWVGGMVREVRVVYTVRALGDEEEEGGGKILFEERLWGLAEKYRGGHAGDRLTEVDFRLTVFETGGSGVKSGSENNGTGEREYRRITYDDLTAALGSEGKRENTLVYVCGPPEMTDGFVGFLQKSPGMDENRVLCEKWW